MFGIPRFYIGVFLVYDKSNYQFCSKFLIGIASQTFVSWISLSMYVYLSDTDQSVDTTTSITTRNFSGPNQKIGDYNGTNIGAFVYNFSYY